MILERPLTENIYSNRAALDLKAYEQKGGYMAVRKAVKEMTSQQVQKLVQESNL